ncbi:hypothetical protein DITRI_Ditri05aG0110500 [Diplodiscus trichospermus]
MALHPHPPSHKQASITLLPLPSPSSQFSSQNSMLDPGTQLPKSHLSLSDHIGRRLSHGYDYESRVQKTAQTYANYRMEGRFGAETYMMEDESGVSTPPLWRTSPSSSPPHRENMNYRCLSPSSKAQAIARGQKELMEMVSRMPESCYELSLKDLVEHQPVVVEPKQERFAEGRCTIKGDRYKKEKGKKKQKHPKPQIKRSGSIDNGGFLLKMAFPISLGSKKNKKKSIDSNTNHNSKVSPKPTASDASVKSVDKDWWKKRSGSSESESGGSTINSGSTKSSRSSSTSSSNSCRSISSSSRRHRRSSCLAFLLARKSKISQ